MGYSETPLVFNLARKDNLESLTILAGSSLLQYIDDLMICSPTKEACEIDMKVLLQHLADNGHKASLSK